MHAILATWSIEYYSYSYCIGGSEICMHADLMLLYLLYLWIMISSKKKSWGKLLSIFCYLLLGGHSGIATCKYLTVWSTFNRYFLLDAFLLDCAFWIVSVYISITAASSNHLNSLIVKKTGFMITKSTGFPKMTNLPV